MTHSPGDDEPISANDFVRLPSFLAGDETSIDLGSRRPGDLSALSLNGYEFVREIHRGGQGVVFLAIQKSTHRKVAIKVMKEGPFAGIDDRARFDREIRILARLKHPNIVTIHDSGRAAGSDYFVMDYVDGESLADVLSRTQPIADLVDLFRRICEAVQAAHVHGIVHRDLKPGNIRIDAAGDPHILDFGLAKTPGSAVDPSHVTQSGFFVGSLPWASPEQAEGHVSRIDARTDVYCLGVILYYMLTKRFPYDIDGALADVLGRVAHSDPIHPRSISRKIDSELETIVLKCLQKEPQRRYANAGEIAADIAAYQAGSPIAARRDSLTYRLRKSAVRSIRSRPLAAKLLLALTSVAAAYIVVRPLVFEYSGLDIAFRRFALNRMPATLQVAAPELEHVRIITLSDQTNIPEIVRRENLNGVDVNELPSLRRLHGRLLERLAKASPRAVMVDLKFRASSRFDDDFVVGVKSLQAAGADVVLAAPSWEIDNMGVPEISPRITPFVRWGCIRFDHDRDGPWTLELFHSRRGQLPQTSIALESFGAYRHPGQYISLDWDHQPSTLSADRRRLYARYWRPSPGRAQAQVTLDVYDAIELSALSVESADAGRDLKKDDVLGYFVVSLPPAAVLKASTVEYNDVFIASDEQLKRWFGGRAVVLGDTRAASRDIHHYHDGRDLGACYAHAVGLDAMLSGSSIGMPAVWTSRTLTLLGGMVGATIVAVIGKGITRPARLVMFTLLCLIAGSIVAVFASVLALRTRGVLVNPTVPLSAAWLAAALSVAIEIVRLRSVPPGTSRSTP